LNASVTQTLSGATALDVRRTHSEAPVASQLARIRQATGLGHAAIVKSFVKLARGPGKISFADFVRLRLFDPQFHSGSVLAAYVGQRRNRDICVNVNYRHDWYGLLSDKVAVASYLTSYGLPTIPIVAIYAPDLARNGRVLTDRRALAAFLTAGGSLFGKPVEGFQSLGSVALQKFLPAERVFETTNGRRVALDDLISEIEQHYRSGYVFQPLVHPHPDVARLCGDRLPCARIVTALTESGAKVIRACWKIPAGRNMADNYWRDGNLLAQIDLDTGEVLRVCSGAGLDVRIHEQHPDTRAGLRGFVIPQWDAMKQLALHGARLMRHVPMIGWDIAPAEKGPIIVEMNETPDFFLVQFADRKGMLDNEFLAFMDFQAKNRAAHERAMRADIAKL
jgi:Sugar-transfer associated ATP-grasp